MLRDRLIIIGMAIVSLAFWYFLISGIVGAATFLNVFQGGTGTSTLPTAGQLLVGQTGGTYALQATSTLGLLSSVSSSSLTILNRTTKSSDYTVLSTDVYVGLTATATVSLPTAVGNAGRYLEL